MLDTHAAPEATRDDVASTYTAPTQDRWEPLFLVSPKADRADLVDFVNIAQECLDDLLSEGTEGGMDGSRTWLVQQVMRVREAAMGRLLQNP